MKNFFQGDGTHRLRHQFRQHPRRSHRFDHRSTSGRSSRETPTRSKSITDQINDFEVQVISSASNGSTNSVSVDAMLRQFPLTQAQVTSELNSLSNLK